MPPWEEIVALMHDRELDYSDTVPRVLYSRDQARRYVILKSEHGFYKYTYEALESMDEEELRWFRADALAGKEVLPAYWNPRIEAGCSIFESEQDVMAAISQEDAYKAYFV